MSAAKIAAERRPRQPPTKLTTWLFRDAIQRRVRSSARKQIRNQSARSRIKTLEKKFLVLAEAGKKDEAATAFRATVAAYDKATKHGVVRDGTASRKQSRLAIRLAKVK